MNGGRSQEVGLCEWGRYKWFECVSEEDADDRTVRVGAMHVYESVSGRDKV